MVKKTIDVEVNAGNSVETIKKIDGAMEGLGGAVDGVNAGLGKMKPVATGVNNALRDGGKSAGKFSQVMGQAGFQVQDFIVQVQGGTSALTAFTQQAPQLAGAFGPGGAIVGAFLAMAGVLGGVLFSSLSDTKSAFEKLQIAIDNTKKIIASSEGGVAQYTEEMRLLAQQSEAAARNTLTVALFKQKEALKQASIAFKEAEESVRGSFNSFNGFVTLLTKAKVGTDEFAKALPKVRNLVSAIDAVGRDASSENINALNVALNGISKNGEFATKQAAELASKLTETSASALAANQNIADLKNTLSQASIVAGEFGTENEKLASGYQDTLDLLDEYNNSEKEQLENKNKLIAATAAQVAALKSQTQAMLNEAGVREQINSGMLTQEEGRNQIELQKLFDYYTARRNIVLENEKLTDQQKQELLTALHEQEVAAQTLRQEQLTAINKKGADARLATAQAESDATKSMLISTAVAAFNLTRSSNQKMTKEQKKQARQNVIINTAAAIARAYGENNFYVASGMAVFLAGMQLQQINKIKSADGGGGAGGGGSFSAVTPSSPPIPTQNTQQLGGFEVRGLEELKDSISSDRLYSGDVVTKLLESIEQFRNLGGE